MYHNRTKFGDEFEDGFSAGQHCHVIAATVGGSLVSGLMSSSASKSAASTQAKAAQQASDTQLTASREANALQWQMYQQNLANNQPGLQAGQSALSALQSGLGLGQTRATGNSPGLPSSNAPTGTYMNAQGQNVDAGGNVVAPGTAAPTNYGATQGELDAAGHSVKPNQFTQGYAPSQLDMDPSYQWRLSQGLKALQGSAAAKGGLLTGQGAIDVNNYAQGAASQEYGAAFDRNRTTQNDLYNRLASLAGVGQTATGAIGAAGANVANNIGQNTMTGASASSNYLTSGANAQAAGTIGASNAIGNGINNAANGWATMQYLNGKPQWQSPSSPGGTDQSVYQYDPNYNPNQYSRGGV